MKYAVITGASSGMGLEFSRQLAERGYGIVLISNRPEENRQAVETIRTTYATDARTIDIDLTLPEAAETVYQQVVTWKLEVEILVSNAGMLLFSTLARTPLEQLDRIVALHCTTPIKLIRLFGEDMLKRRHGYILVTSSSTAWMPYPTISHYAATKAFLKSFSRSVWYEFRRYGVSVTTLFPGAVDTPLYQLDDRKRYWFRKAGMMQTPQQTVSAALRSMFRKKHRCIPGFFFGELPERKRILSLATGILAIRDGMLGTMMVASQTSHTLLPPYRFTVNQPDVVQRTHLLTPAARDTGVFHAEPPGRRPETVEQRPEEIRLQGREPPRITIHPLHTLRHEPCNLRHTYFRFLTFGFSHIPPVDIKARKTDIRIRHYHRETGLTLPATPADSLAEDLGRLARIVSTGTDKIQISRLFRKLYGSNQLKDNGRGAPGIDRKDEPHLFIGTKDKTPVRCIDIGYGY